MFRHLALNNKNIMDKRFVNILSNNCRLQTLDCSILNGNVSKWYEGRSVAHLRRSRGFLLIYLLNLNNLRFMKNAEKFKCTLSLYF